MEEVKAQCERFCDDKDEISTAQAKRIQEQKSCRMDGRRSISLSTESFEPGEQ